MIDGIEDLYQKIAEAIEASISGDWRSAIVEAVFYSDNCSYNGEYVLDGFDYPKPFAVKSDVVRSLYEMRRRFTAKGKRLWCSVRFELKADGKFKLDWGYGGCDEQGFATFDAAKEAERQRQIRLRQGLMS